MFDFVDPVVQQLIENKRYKKSKEEQKLLERAADYIAQKPRPASSSKIRSFFRFFKP